MRTLLILACFVPALAVAGERDELTDILHNRNSVKLAAFIKKLDNANPRLPHDRTLLHRLLEVSWNSEAERLLRRGGSPNTADSQGVTPLMDCARRGDVRGIQLLLKWKANPNQRDGSGKTALFYASDWQRTHESPRGGDEGNAAAIRALVKGGANVNARDDQGRTALMWAAVRDHALPADALIRSGADLSALDRLHCSALTYALHSMKVSDPIPQLLISAHPALGFEDALVLNDQARVMNLITKGIEGVRFGLARETPLEIACKYANPEIVRLLLARGADPDERDQNGRTALHYATGLTMGFEEFSFDDRPGRRECIDLLLKAGASPNYSGVMEQGRDSLTPLALASLIGPSWMVSQLLQGGADPNVLSKSYSFDELYDRKEFAVVAEMIDYGRRIRSSELRFSINTMARTREILAKLSASGKHFAPGLPEALCAATLVNDIPLMELSFKLGDPINCAEGIRSPLHCAAEVGALESVIWLLEHGADVRAKDGKGRTPAEVARMTLNAKVAIILEHWKA